MCHSAERKKFILITLHRIENYHLIRLNPLNQFGKTSINRTVLLFLMKNQNKFHPQTTEDKTQNDRTRKSKRRRPK